MKQWKNIVHSKRDSCTGIFLWIILNTSEQLFYGTRVKGSSDLGKYLRMLAVKIAFGKYIWIFGICENRV